MLITIAFKINENAFISDQNIHHQTAQNPPSTGIVMPLSILDLSLKRNIIASATSSGSKMNKNIFFIEINFLTMF